VYRHAHLRPGRLAGLAAVVSAVVLACGTGLPAQAALTGSAPAGPAMAQRPAGAVRTVLLMTGDQLVISSQGSQRLITDRSPAQRDPMVGIRHGATMSEIPAAALPYLGRGLSPALFQLATLEKAESHGQLPVRVAFSGKRPDIPGLTVTAAGAGSATGYLTAASARTFGAALLRQYTADHATGRYGTDGLFGHGVAITPAVGGPVAAARAKPAPARPGFKMHTLTVHAANLAGRPDTGDQIAVYNADNYDRLSGLFEGNFFYHGTAKFSVPAGHYWAVATYFFGSGGSSLRLVVVPQFRVAGTHSSLHVAEKSASSKITFATPRPARDYTENFTVVRHMKHGPAFIWTDVWDGPLAGWISPTTRKPTVASLRAYTSATLISPPKAASYAYNVDKIGPSGLIPPQHFSVGHVAAVTERYYRDAATQRAGWGAVGGDFDQSQFAILAIVQTSMPQVQTQYFTATPNIRWQNEILTNYYQDGGLYTDDVRIYRPGQHLSQDWNRYPLHPGEDSTLGGRTALFPALISAARLGNELSLTPTPWSDNQPSHIGGGFGGNGNAATTGSYVIDQNGQRIAHGDAVNGIPYIKLSAKPATIKYTLSASRAGGGFRLSPASTTVWTWRTKRHPAATVPKAWACGFDRNYHPTRTCAVQPLLTLQYLVRGERLTGQTAPGRQKITLNVRHIQLGGSAAITKAAAQVSFNDGNTWTPATLTGHAGHYTISFKAPAGVAVSLKVSASDANGGSIAETLIRGYGVGQ
jgi:hypothetical protein